MLALCSCRLIRKNVQCRLLVIKLNRLDSVEVAYGAVGSGLRLSRRALFLEFYHPFLTLLYTWE